MIFNLQMITIQKILCTNVDFTKDNYTYDILQVIFLLKIIVQKIFKIQMIIIQKKKTRGSL